MLDPIGGLGRIREFWLSYLDTAFRIGNVELAEARRALLRKPGMLTTDAFLEPVPRYRESKFSLDDLVTLDNAAARANTGCTLRFRGISAFRAFSW